MKKLARINRIGLISLFSFCLLCLFCFFSIGLFSDLLSGLFSAPFQTQLQTPLQTPLQTQVQAQTQVRAQTQVQAQTQAQAQSPKKPNLSANSNLSTANSNLSTTNSTLPAASPDLDLVVFPPTAYLTIKPGAAIKHQILLEYKGDVAIYLTPQLVDFETDGLTGQPILQEPSKLKFLELKNQGWAIGQATRLKPETKVQLVLEVSPPVHARLQEHPLSLLLTAEPATDVIRDGSRAQAKGAVASNVILSVQPDYKNLGELVIGKLKAARFVDSFHLIDFELIAANVGRNAVSARGEVELTHGWSGKKLKHWFIYPDVVLAESTRRLRGLLTGPTQLEPGQEVEFEDFSYKPAFLLGPYQLRVELSDASQVGTDQADRAADANDIKKRDKNFDEQDLVHEQTEEIIALPFSVVGLLLLGFILSWAYSRGYSRWRDRNRSRSRPRGRPRSRLRNRPHGS